LALPRRRGGTKSPIRAIQAGVAIEPKNACIAINNTSWLAEFKNNRGNQSRATIKPPKMMKGTLRPSLSLSLP